MPDRLLQTPWMADADFAQRRGLARTKARVGTIISRNHAPAARVLAQSLNRHHPELRLVVLQVDHEVFPLDELDERFDLLTPRDIGVGRRELHRLAAIYDALEVCDSLKPRLLQYLLSTGADAAVYLDSDIELFARIDDLFQTAHISSILLTPQLAEPPPDDGLYPDEMAFLHTGVYNGGFVGVGPGAAPFLEWWDKQLRWHCLHEDKLFGDQRWLDFAPCFCDHAITRDPGCNVAWWNLGSRGLELGADGKYRVNGRPLRFFHYSYFDPETPELLFDWNPELPHRARVAADHPHVAELCERYAGSLFASGYREDSAIRYQFATTASGLPLDVHIRRAYRAGLLQLGDEDAAALPDPFSQADAERFVQWLHSTVPDAALT